MTLNLIEDAYMDLPDLDQHPDKYTNMKDKSIYTFVSIDRRKTIITPYDSPTLNFSNWNIIRFFLNSLRVDILRELIIDNTNIRRLPPMPYIEILHATNAGIYFLPEYAPNLKQLIVSNNSIRFLPFYKKLQFLDISNNWIKSIDYTIKTVIARNNPITGIVMGESVDVTDCPVLCIPRTTFAKSSQITNGKLTWKTANRYVYNSNCIYLNWSSRIVHGLDLKIYKLLPKFLGLKVI